MKVTKIEKNRKVFPTKRLAEKELNNAVFDSGNRFQNVTIEITKAQGDILDKFCEYCQLLSLCVHCHKKDPTNSHFTSNDHDELVFTCRNCFGISIDATEQSKYYIRWINSILKDYNMNFKDGFPKLIKTVWREENES